VGHPVPHVRLLAANTPARRAPPAPPRPRGHPIVLGQVRQVTRHSGRRQGPCARAQGRVGIAGHDARLCKDGEAGRSHGATRQVDELAGHRRAGEPFPEGRRKPSAQVWVHTGRRAPHGHVDGPIACRGPAASCTTTYLFAWLDRRDGLHGNCGGRGLDGDGRRLGPRA